MSITNTYLWAFSQAICPECSSCEKPIGVYQCVGCGKVFCPRDTHTHRQVLRGELQELIFKSEQWNSKWTEEIRNRQRDLKTDKDSLLEQIDNWELQAIAKIRQAATEAREHSRKLYDHHMNRLQNWILDTTMLKQALETDGFLETHLKRWKTELKRFKSKINTFKRDFVRVRKEESFISKFIVEGDFLPNEPLYELDHEDPEILTPPVYLMVPVDDDFGPYNQGELRSGVHNFRYRSKCIFFGVASKNAPIANEPWNTPTTYGWTGDNLVYLNGHPVQGHQGYESDMELGDTCSLMVDCDRKVIQLTNERTNQTHKIDVNPSICPLPWQLNVRFLDDTHK